MEVVIKPFLCDFGTGFSQIPVWLSLLFGYLRLSTS
jgi:hypothetical protein